MNERVVHVNKGKILGIIRKNLEKHQKEYRKAVKVWADDLKVALRDILSTITPDSDGNCCYTLVRKYPKPESHADDYKRAVGMLEMDVRKTVELTETEYRRFVEDEWDWKEAWRTTNSRYLNK